MKKSVTIYLFCISLFTQSGIFSLYAQKDHLSTDTVPLNEVVISGTRTITNRNQVPATISVVTKEELDESSESAILPVLSERIPGLFVTERGVTGFGLSSGSAGTVNIHGVGGGNKVLMMFDGQPQWAGIFGHHLPDTYVTSDAERVEVIRGPASLLYGSNAMGGVINIITQKAKEDGFHGRGRLLYGSYNTQKYMLNAGGKKGKFNGYASINHDRTDGQRPHSEFYITNGYTKLGYDFSSHWNVSGNIILAKFESNNPGTIQNPMNENWAEALRGTYSLSLQNSYEKANGAIQAFYNFGNHKINDGYKNGEPPLDYLFRSDDYNAGAALYESFHLFTGNQITAGVDFKQWGGRAWNAYTDGSKKEIIDTHVDECAVYGLVQQTLVEKLTLNAGIRLEMNEEYGNEWVPQAGVAYRFSDRTVLKASASKGFRSPNIRELYMFTPVNNPDLKPEKMNNYDFSYLQKLLDNKLEIELTAYFAKGKDMIAMTRIDGKPKNINTGAFINKGFDVAASYALLPELKLSGNYSFLDSDIQITGAPKHQAFFNVLWKKEPFSFACSYQYVSGLYTTDYNLPVANPLTESYGLLSAKASYQPVKWISFFINGENLTDTSYEMYTGYPMPGIVVMGGIDFRF